MDHRDLHRFGPLMPWLGFATINLAYVALMVGAFCSSMNRVRALLVVAAGLFVAYGLVTDVQSIVAWNLIVGGLNLKRLVSSLSADVRVSLTGDQETTRRVLLPDLTPSRFRAIWDLGEELVRVDEPVGPAAGEDDRLHLLLRGTVTVSRDGQPTQRLGPGAMIASCPAHRIHADGAARLYSWSYGELEQAGLLRELVMATDSHGRTVTLTGVTG